MYTHLYIYICNCCTHRWHIYDYMGLAGKDLEKQFSYRLDEYYSLCQFYIYKVDWYVNYVIMSRRTQYMVEKEHEINDNDLLYDLDKFSHH